MSPGQTDRLVARTFAQYVLVQIENTYCLGRRYPSHGSGNRPDILRAVQNLRSHDLRRFAANAQFSGAIRGPTKATVALRPFPSIRANFRRPESSRYASPANGQARSVLSGLLVVGPFYPTLAYAEDHDSLGLGEAYPKRTI